ncbi:Rrf2 family transcriptional regulator [Micromonospora sp. NBC_00362]|uniref:RrF2 family transcriptional regulator n=1 Tax=Micromonospora sp. NBC_00362 TaxID=2975975 RepID=UPI00225178AA|nr:Rrf2 family transcriptional regulator [Micromonospora sp. NBC_00362]MCX5121740.1 Rrf2 family transcriptional regulator [Micromonospora sp. NBC_00362]
MRMSEGVEWALHSCLNLSWVDSGRAVTAAKLAAFYELPAAYLNKQLQALTRAGILSSSSGPRGGFQLARSPAAITLLDIVTAIEGPDEAFRCDEILRQGPGGDPETDYRQTCLISQGMRRADIAWRRELAAQTLADIKSSVEQKFPAAPLSTRNRLAALRA